MKSIPCLQAAIAITGLCLALLGCAATPDTGRNFDPSQLRHVVKGRTTADQILAMFGPPYASNPATLHGSRHPMAGERWFYSYDTVSVQQIYYPGATAGLYLPAALTFRYVPASTITAKHHREVAILFNKDRTVVNYRIKELHM